MIYQSVSIENVISKVRRDTKISDTSALMELYEVIPEAIGMMQTRFQLHHTYKDVWVHFHKAQLPSGLMVLPAVEWCGHRLRWKHSSRAVTAPVHHRPEGFNAFDPEGRPVVPVSFPDIPIDNVGTDEFITMPTPAVNPADGFTFMSWTITEFNQLPIHRDAYYWVEMGYLNTSFPHGWVRIHYHEAPTDQNGNLLIPDNSFYKEAIYYWCRAKLIGMGVFEDRWIGEEKCMQRFELNAGRAIDEIDYPTEDQMQAIVANQVALIPNTRYWDDFGSNRRHMTYG